MVHRYNLDDMARTNKNLHQKPGPALKREVRKAASQFKKGNKAAKGLVRGETTPEQKEVTLLSREMVTRFISQYVGFSRADLTRRLKAPDTPMLECIIIQIILKSEKNADQWRLEFLLNRTVGKVKDELEVTNPDPYAGLTDAELIARRQALAEKNLETLRMMSQAIAPKQQLITQQEASPNVSTEVKPEGPSST